MMEDDRRTALGMVVLAVMMLALLGNCGTRVKAQQPASVFDCVVTQLTERETAVICEVEDSKQVTIRVAAGQWQFDSWPAEVRVGQLLKATRVAGRLTALEDCATRLQRAVEAYCGGMYCKAPLSSLEPEDCGRPKSKFIAGLLERYGKL